ncbi:MAG: DNA polymerase-3 subunit epsilon, partial [Bacteroidia bacterium]
KMTGLQTTKEACFDHQIGRCHGICIGKEAPEAYNERVTKAIESFTLQCGTYLVWLKGRSREERAFIYIEDGIYRGYGYVDPLNQSNVISDILETIIPQKHNAEIQHILNAQMQYVPSKNIVHFANSN